MFRTKNTKCIKPNIVIIVGNATSDNILLNQPISQEHTTLLLKICEDIRLDTSSLYITNILKCVNKAPKISEHKECFSHIINEVDAINPCSILLCGKEVSKIYKKFNHAVCFSMNVFPIIELPSLHLLLSGRAGISRLSNLLKELSIV